MSKLIKSPLLIIFLITALTHFFNLFGYPPIAGDEGLYAGQGWWLVNFGKITPYTYWYDHFPLSWLQIGIWQKLTGGPFTFGMAVFSARVFVTLLVILTNIFLFLTVKKLTQNEKIALISSFIFAASPLAIFYHRQVLLDNIAVFWLIVSLYFLLTAEGKLFRFFLAGLFWGIAFLSKESVLFFLPAYFLTGLVLTKRQNRSFSFLILFLTFVGLASLFPLLALLKGEFLPHSWLGKPPKVSFLETFIFQFGRGKGLPFWQAESDFGANFLFWLKQDFLLVTLGLWGVVVSLLFGSSLMRLVCLFGISYLLFLVRGGLVLDFYIIPLIPFLAISLGLLIFQIYPKFVWLERIPKKFFIFILLILIPLYLLTNRNLFFLEATKNQQELVGFIKNNLSQDSVIVSDFTPWVDLKPNFPNTEWFYKVELDPEIRMKKLNNDPLNIDYLVLSNEVVSQLKSGEYPFLSQALANSVLIKDFPPLVPGQVRDLEKLISHDTSWVAIYQVVNQNQVKFGDLL